MEGGITLFRIGIDTGGTFTDCVALDEGTGEVRIVKVPSTPRQPHVAPVRALERVWHRFGISPSEIGSITYGTTIATNALITGQLPPVGLVTTRGFRDVLEIGTQMRPSLYDLVQEKPKPLVPRRHRMEITERIGPKGEIITPLNQSEIGEIVRRVRSAGLRSVAVCFLFSYANPEHERLVREALLRELPGIYCCISSEVCPEFREYLRTSTTVINACVAPVVGEHLLELGRAFVGQGLLSELLIMQSNGGTVGVREASARFAHCLLRSGLAGGVMGGKFIADLAGFRNIVTLDMGGTSCDVSLVLDGQPRLVPGIKVKDAYPMQTPVLDVHTIGAGGGSIAWVDKGGALKVGPQSAGADPGPACYGAGGEEPTVTDANLILGRINPEYFLGGEMTLDVGRAEEAVGRLARRLGMSTLEMASGILEVANAGMVAAIRVVSTRRGHDPREFALVAFGGAGPLHATKLAKEMGMKKVIVPVVPGLLSALGLLACDIRHEYYRTHLVLAEGDLESHVAAVFDEMEREARAALQDERVSPDRQLFVRSVDMRYVGQEYYLTIPCGVGHFSSDHVRSLVSAFHQEHARAYGHSAPGEPVEIVNLRLTAVGLIPRPALKPRQGPVASAEPVATRPVYFEDARRFVETPVYRRDSLAPGTLIAGPAVIEELDSTVLLLPGDRAIVDEHGNLVMDVGA
jgi:N-methylhydantoinase A